MKAKNYTFSMSFEFIADNEQDAINQFQEMIDDWEIDNIFDAKNWIVDKEEVEISDNIK
jgi:hypothetical protein